MSKPKTDPFAARVAASAKSAAKSSSKEIAGALGRLVSARLKTRQRTTQQSPCDPFVPTPAQLAALLNMQRHRKAARRVGKMRRYTATTKPDYSRPGTFRTYMISTIRAHTDTQSANAAHALCDNPSFAKNKLDFNWAADNGYITFD